MGTDEALSFLDKFVLFLKENIYNKSELYCVHCSSIILLRTAKRTVSQKRRLPHIASSYFCIFTAFFVIKKQI